MLSGPIIENGSTWSRGWQLGTERVKSESRPTLQSGRPNHSVQTDKFNELWNGELFGGEARDKHRGRNESNYFWVNTFYKREHYR